MCPFLIGNNNLNIQNNTYQNQYGKKNNFINNSKKGHKKLINDFKNPPLIGLFNISSTCYMNAPLQCLSNIKPLTNYFLYNKELYLEIPKYSEEKKIAKAYSDVIYNLWDENNNKKEFNPSYFIEILNKEDKRFEAFKANDAKDFILFLYSKMHKELNRKNKNEQVEEFKSDGTDPEVEYFKCKNNFESRNKSIISDTFYFDQVKIKKCLKCKTLIYKFSMYNILLFPLESVRLFKQKDKTVNVNIFDCFEYYTNYKKENEQNYCNKCQENTDHDVSHKISTYPKILTIILNRGNNLEFSVGFQITYLLEDLDKYMIKLESNKNQKNIRYELIGIVIHEGKSGEEGHFLTYCKSPVDKKWYSYNDSRVKYLKEPLEAIKGIPYLLFYQKIK